MNSVQRQISSYPCGRQKCKGSAKLKSDGVKEKADAVVAGLDQDGPQDVVSPVNLGLYPIDGGPPSRVEDLLLRSFPVVLKGICRG